MVMESMRLDRQGVNVGNKLSMAFVGPQYGDVSTPNIKVAGDIKSLGSAGNIRPRFTEKRRLNSMTYVFDIWEITENITFQLDSYIPEIDRLAGRRNVQSTVGRDAETHIRTTENQEKMNLVGDEIRPRIYIYPALQNISPSGNQVGHAKNGLVIVAEGIWFPAEISHEEGELITYDCEFQPDIFYARSIAGQSPSVLETDHLNSEIWHDFARDIHYIDGINQTRAREERMGLFATA